MLYMSKEVKSSADELKDRIVSLAGIELEKSQSKLLSKSITWHLEFDKADGKNAVVLRWEAINSNSTFLECLVEKWVLDISEQIRFNIITRAY